MLLIVAAVLVVMGILGTVFGGNDNKDDKPAAAAAATTSATTTWQCRRPHRCRPRAETGCCKVKNSFDVWVISNGSVYASTCGARNTTTWQKPSAAPLQISPGDEVVQALDTCVVNLTPLIDATLNGGPVGSPQLSSSTLVCRRGPVSSDRTKGRYRVGMSAIDRAAFLGKSIKPSSENEQGQQARAEDMIRKAITTCDAFNGSNVQIYTKGSYPNNPNVRPDSDVDVVVELHDCSLGLHVGGLGSIG